MSRRGIPGLPTIPEHCMPYRTARAIGWLFVGAVIGLLLAALVFNLPDALDTLWAIL